MPAPATTDALVTLVRKSGLVDPHQLDQLLQQPGCADLPPDKPRKLARRLVAAGVLTDLQARQLLEGKFRGFTLGKYLLLEDLRSYGPFSAFLFKNLESQERVVIQMLPGMGDDRPLARARIRQEARVLAGLDHPNVAGRQELEHEGSQYFLVASFLDGCSLRQIVRKHGPMDISRAAHYIRQAAVGLQRVHDAGLVHGDLAAHNLILDRRGNVRVINVGLARFYRQPGGEADAPGDVLADLSSLGAAFHYLLCGKSPADGEQPQALEPIRNLRPEVPEGLAAVLEKLGAGTSEQGFHTADELIEALEPWTQAPVAPPPAEEMLDLSPAAQADSTALVPARTAGVSLPATPEPSPAPRVAGPDRRPPLTANPPDSNPSVNLFALEDETDDRKLIADRPSSSPPTEFTLANTETMPELPAVPESAPPPPPKKPSPAPPRTAVPPKSEPARPPAPEQRSSGSPRRSGPVSYTHSKVKVDASAGAPKKAKKGKEAQGSSLGLGREFWLVLLLLLVWLPLGYFLSQAFRSDHPEESAAPPPPLQPATPVANPAP